MTDEDKFHQELIKAEFSENWNYIRHAEDLRVKLTNIYFTIVTASIAVISFIGKSSYKNETGDLILFLERFKYVISINCLFLFCYGLSLALFFIMQKRNYDNYLARNREIIGTITGKFSNKNKTYKEKTRNIDFFSAASTYWFSLYVIINCLLLFIVSFIFQFSAEIDNAKTNLIILKSIGISFTGAILQYFMFVQVVKRKESLSSSTPQYYSKQKVALLCIIVGTLSLFLGTYLGTISK